MWSYLGEVGNVRAEALYNPLRFHADINKTL